MVCIDQTLRENTKSGCAMVFCFKIYFFKLLIINKINFLNCALPNYYDRLHIKFRHLNERWFFYRFAAWIMYWITPPGAP